MPIFEYTAINGKGKSKKGYIESDSIEMAKDRLATGQLLVTELASYHQTKKELRLPPQFVLTFTRDLAQLLKAGLPLYESLMTIEENYREHKSHLVLLDLCDQVKHGTQLSVALKRYPKSFTGVYIAMCAAGERSAQLVSVFEELSNLLQRSQQLKKQMTSAMIYPAFIGSFCLVVIAALLFFLVPSMAELFEGRELHPMTSAVLSISHFFMNHALIVGACISTAVMCLAFFCSHPKFISIRAHLMMHMPLVKDFTMQAVMVRFCRTLARLLKSGVPLLEGLQLARGVMQNHLFEQAIEASEAKVMEGRSLSGQLKKHPIIPAPAVRMLGIAEESGNTADMLGHIADLYNSELEKHLSRLTSYLQPVILLVLGMIVGVILLAVLLPLTDVSSFLE